MFIGFFEDGEGSAAKTFGKVADSYDDLRFAHTSSKEILEKQGYKELVLIDISTIEH